MLCERRVETAKELKTIGLYVKEDKTGCEEEGARRWLYREFRTEPRREALRQTAAGACIRRGPANRPLFLPSRLLTVAQVGTTTAHTTP